MKFNSRYKTYIIESTKKSDEFKIRESEFYKYLKRGNMQNEKYNHPAKRKV